MLITSSADVTPAWLTRTLGLRRALKQGRVTAVTPSVQAANNGTFADTASLAVTYSADVTGPVPHRLFLKCSKPTLPNEMLAWGEREVGFYHAMAGVPEADSFIPRCHDAAYDPATGHSHVLLDDLSITHFQRPLPIPPSPRHYELLVESLARLHAHWWENSHLNTALRPLWNDESTHERRQRLEMTWPSFFDFLGDALLPDQQALYEQVLASSLLERRAERWRQRRAVTLLQGDCHPGNCLLPRDPVRDRAILIDWHLWEIGVGTDDLAFLIAHKWNPVRRAALERSLLRQYHQQLVTHGVNDYRWEDCWHDYRESVALVTLVPIGQFRRKQHPAIIWVGLENSTTAYADLNCADVI